MEPPKAHDGVSVDMDWDDDDEEKTSVFGRDSAVGGEAQSISAESDDDDDDSEDDVTRVAPSPAHFLASAGAPSPPGFGLRSSLPAPLPASSLLAQQPASSSLAPPSLSAPPPGAPPPPMGGGLGPAFVPSSSPLGLTVAGGSMPQGHAARATFPPMAAPSRPPMPAPPRTSLPPPSISHDFHRSMPPVPTPALADPFSGRSRRSNGKLMAIGAVAVAIAAGGAYVAMPHSGRILVVAAGEAGRSLERVAISIDGVKKCEVVPCTIELDKGVHITKAAAEGYIPQQEGITVRAGEDTSVNFKLEKSSSGTGLKVSGKQDGIVLSVDGKEIGPLPQELRTLSPGSHTLRFKGSDRYVPDERSITIGENEMKDLGTVSLKVARGLATFDVRTPGAKVMLVSGSERRQLPDASQPVEVDTSKNWAVEATKPGYEDFHQPLTFEDRADRTFVIDLAEKGSAARATWSPPPAAPAVASRKPVANAVLKAVQDDEAPSPAPAPAPAPADGTCTLNLNSIPVANVVVDGKPLGSTPKMGVSVAAGSHSILFVNEDGKKAMSASCRSGETKTVATRLTAPSE